MPLSVFEFVADWYVLCPPGLGAAAQESHAEVLFFFSAVQRCNRRAALQAAAWRAASHAARNVQRSVVQSRDTLTADLNRSLSLLGGLDRNLYGPLRAKQVVRMLQCERDVAQRVLLARPQLQRLFDENRELVDHDWDGSETSETDEDDSDAEAMAAQEEP